MSSLAERTGHAQARTSDRPRDLQEVVVDLADGTRLRGVLHRAQGTRTLDFLNRQAEGFVAFTGATLERLGEVEQVAFVAINKAHIVRLIEAD